MRAGRVTAVGLRADAAEPWTLLFRACSPLCFFFKGRTRQPLL